MKSKIRVHLFLLPFFVLCAGPAIAAIVEFQFKSVGALFDSENPLIAQVDEQVEVELWARVLDNDGLGLAGYAVDIESSNSHLLATPHPYSPDIWQVDFFVPAGWTSMNGDLVEERRGVQDHFAAWLPFNPPTPVFAADTWTKISTGLFDAASEGMAEISLLIPNPDNITVFFDDDGTYRAVVPSMVDTGDSLAVLVVPEPASLALLLGGAAIAILRRRRPRIG